MSPFWGLTVGVPTTPRRVLLRRLLGAVFCCQKFVILFIRATVFVYFIFIVVIVGVVELLLSEAEIRQRHHGTRYAASSARWSGVFGYHPYHSHSVLAISRP